MLMKNSIVASPRAVVGMRLFSEPGLLGAGWGGVVHPEGLVGGVLPATVFPSSVAIGRNVVRRSAATRAQVA
jgi:hypothetical protein